MKPYKAFLFDLNGTMIDDMEYHIVAWHGILNKLGAGISLAQMKEECYGKNTELLERMFPKRFTDEEKDAMSYEKEKHYQQAFAPKLKLIDGLHDFLDKAHASGIKMAIGSAAIMFNIDFVLDGLDIRKYFDVIVSADDVTDSKPDPETYLQCAAKLGIDAKDCLVFEDVPKGVEAAMNANMNAVVITTMHHKEEFENCSNVISFIGNYHDGSLTKLIQ